METRRPPEPTDGVGREGTRLVVRRAFGSDVVDLDRIKSLEEVGLCLRIADEEGRQAAVALDSEAARADVLYRIAEWCAPLLKPKIRRLLETGIRLRAEPGPARGELWALGGEALGAALLAFVVGHWFGWLAAAIFAGLRAARRLRRAAALRAPLVLEPAPSQGFARLVEGAIALRLDRTTFDVGAWSRGRAVLTDGLHAIPLPLGERAGAFFLFAALLEACGSPDDRLVD